MRFCQDSLHDPPGGETYDRYTGVWQSGFSPWSDLMYNDPEQPVVCVSYEDCRKYCLWLTHKCQDSIVLSVSLPLPIVWDYAARRSSGNDLGDPIFIGTKVVHHRAACPAPIDKVGLRTNVFGIADLFGNVFEWCAEHWVRSRDSSRRDRISSSGFRPPDRPLKYATLMPTLVPRLDPNRDKWKREYLVKGGSFLDDLERTIPAADANELPNKTQTKHSDLGFRICALVTPCAFPTWVQQELAGSPIVERAKPDWI